MAKSERSFWSSIPGVLTGLAGVLTAVVGLLTLAYNLGWLGDGPVDEGATGTSIPTISVEPEALRFLPLQRTKTVSVTNRGTQAVTVATEITGDSRDAFSVDDGACAGELTPGRSCAVEVSAVGGVGRHRARLVVSADGDAHSAEVELEATDVS